MKNTSPLSNKIIIIYNRHYFNSLHKYMSQNYLEFFTDVSGTVWNIRDVCKILLTPEKKAK